MSEKKKISQMIDVKLLQSIQDKRITVSSLISSSGQIKAQGTLIGAIFIGKGSRIVFSTVLSVRNNRCKQ